MKILTLKANIGKSEPEVTLLERSKARGGGEKSFIIFNSFFRFVFKNLTSGMRIYAAHIMEKKLRLEDHNYLK